MDFYQEKSSVVFLRSQCLVVRFSHIQCPIFHPPRQLAEIPQLKYSRVIFYSETCKKTAYAHSKRSTLWERIFMVRRSAHLCLFVLATFSTYAIEPKRLLTSEESNPFPTTPEKHEKRLVQKNSLAYVYRLTKKTAHKGYWTPQGRIYPNRLAVAKKMQEKTTLHDHPAKLVPSSTPRHVTTFEIVNQDALDAALVMKQRGLSPCVLNLANAFMPGGGVEHGSKAQEEDIFRRSNYYFSLYPDFNKKLRKQIRLYQLSRDGKAMEACRPNGRKDYLVPEFGGIYSPSVCVFREGEAKQFAFMRRPCCIAFIAAAAYNRKQTHFPRDENQGNSDYGPVSQEAYESNTKEKIRVILRIAAIHHHQDVLLGAFGCGAFQNDANLIASLYAQVFNEPEFKSRFTHIVFAILSKSEPGSNFDVFSNNADLLALQHQGKSVKNTLSDS